MKASKLSRLFGPLVGTLVISAFGAQAALTQFTSQPLGNSVAISGELAVANVRYGFESQVIIGTVTTDLAELFSVQPRTPDFHLVAQVPLRSLHSGMRYLDELMQEKLQMDRHPAATLTIQHAKVAESRAGEPVQAELKGTLAATGVTNQVTIAATITKLADDAIRLNLSFPLNMTNFGIQFSSPTLVREGSDLIPVNAPKPEVNVKLVWCLQKRKLP
jgi:polyisoprenoid-binding protein YceI